jgi:hypothetical protein
MKLPHASARYLQTKLIGVPRGPGQPDGTCLLVTVCEDEEGRVPMGMVGFDLAVGESSEERERLYQKARELQEAFDALAIGTVSFDPV